MIAIGVRDTGKGMSKEVLERVFSPFSTTKGKGYGLALALIRKAVEDWGGQVEIASREGQGTQITLRLPPALAVPGA
jgi:signal transduction histidine kinase